MAELNRADIFNNTTLCYYCICQGWGIGGMSPLVAADAKQLCVHSTCGTMDIGGDDGFCYSIANQCCITQHFAIPPAKDTYPCICFNKKFGTQRAEGTASKKDLFDLKSIMDETFWIYYVFCAGWGFNKCKGPLIQSEFKELCCGGSAGMVQPVEDGIFCSSVSTELCIWSEFQLPPAPKNPKCACLSWRLSKEEAKAAPNKPSLPPTTAPGQAEMH